MKKIRILHIVECAGGVDRYLRMLLTQMDKNSFEQILVCSHNFNREVYFPFVDSFEYVDMRNSLSLKNDVKSMVGVRRIVKRYCPDIVYCHSSKGGGIGRLACIGLHIPVIYNPHGWAFSMKGSKLKSFLYLCFEKMLAPLTNHFVMISNYEKMTALQHHVTTENKISVIFNGIDIAAVENITKSLDITRHTLGIPDNAYVVGMVGRITPQKAPDVFVKAASKVKSSINNAYFVIVGDGEGHDDLVELAVSEGVANCLLITGWVDNPLAYAHLFDTAVLLSRWEGFGLVLAEYMCLGKPIVATRVGAIPDLITDYENGLLVDMNNSQQAADAICRLYNEKELRQGFIENGFLRAKILFDIRRVAREHERLITRICKKKIS